MFQILLYISLIKQLLMPQEDEYTYEEKLRREILFSSIKKDVGVLIIFQLQHYGTG